MIKTLKIRFNPLTHFKVHNKYIINCMYQGNFSNLGLQSLFPQLLLIWVADFYLNSWQFFGKCMPDVFFFFFWCRDKNGKPLYLKLWQLHWAISALECSVGLRSLHIFAWQFIPCLCQICIFYFPSAILFFKNLNAIYIMHI